MFGSFNYLGNLMTPDTFCQWDTIKDITSCFLNFCPPASRRSFVVMECASVWPVIRVALHVSLSVLPLSTRKSSSHLVAPLILPPPPAAADLPSEPTCRAWTEAAVPGCCRQERRRPHTRPWDSRRREAATSGTIPSLRRRTQEVLTGTTV